MLALNSLIISSPFERPKTPLRVNSENFETAHSQIFLEGREGGVLIPLPRKLFFSNASSNPTIPARVPQIEIPFPFSYCFFFHESQSQCTKSQFPASKKGKSQLSFYPFTTLFLQNNSQNYLSRQKQCEIFD